MQRAGLGTRSFHGGLLRGRTGDVGTSKGSNKASPKSGDYSEVEGSHSIGSAGRFVKEDENGTKKVAKAREVNR